MALLAFGAITARAAWLGVVRHEELKSESNNEFRRTAELPAKRGTILMGSGVILASDVPAVNVEATPTIIRNPAAVAALVAPKLGRPAKAVQRVLERRSTYEVLARGVSPARGAAIKETLRSNLVDGRVVDGIDVIDTQRRDYPGKTTASQIVGLTSADGNGMGIEAQYDSALTGTPGRRVVDRNPAGETVRVLENDPGVAGKDVTLTLDPEIQNKVEEVLERTVTTTGAKAAMAVVMRPRDGAILGMASAPTFDASDRSEIEFDQVRNRPVTDLFEPGSVFKLVTMAGAIEEGVVSPATTLYVPSTLNSYDRTLGEAHDRPAETMSVSRILTVSSNVGTVCVAMKPASCSSGKPSTRAQRVQAQSRFLRWSERFGFGSRTGIDFPGEAQGRVLKAEDWSGVTILNFPIGQGLSTTLVQLARAYASVANGGYLVTPHLVSKVGATPTRHARTRVLLPSTVEALRGMLESVVSGADGTGANAAVAGYRVAGKTGTANKYDVEAGQYSKRYVSSFVGYLPARSPKLLIAIAVDDPSSGQYYGGEVAAPAFKEIGDFALNEVLAP